MNWSPHTSLIGLLLAAENRITRFSRAALAAEGLADWNLSRVGVLALMLEAPKSVSEISVTLEISQPTALIMLEKMKSAGWVQSRADSMDGRKKQWSLTAQGKREFARAAKRIREVGKALDGFLEDAGYTKQDVERTKGLLHALKGFFSRGGSLE